MKALLLMPFAFAAGPEGFALFGPYLVAVLAVLYLVRARRQSGRQSRRQSRRGRATFRFRLPSRAAFDILPDAQPAM